MWVWIFGTFPTQNGLKQDHNLSQQLFNLASDCSIRKKLGGIGIEWKRVIFWPAEQPPTLKERPCTMELDTVVCFGV